jgi:hypothetical protein
VYSLGCSIRVNVRTQIRRGIMMTKWCGNWLHLTSLFHVLLLHLTSLFHVLLVLLSSSHQSAEYNALYKYVLVECGH